MGYCISMESSSFRVQTENTGRVLKNLERYCYTAELDDDGNIIGVDFIGDKLSYDEEKMFQSIAPYVEDGSYIEMSGEDGARWKWAFNGGKFKEIQAKIIWLDE